MQSRWAMIHRTVVQADVQRFARVYFGAHAPRGIGPRVGSSVLAISRRDCG